MLYERTLNLLRHGVARATPLFVNGFSCGSVKRDRGGKISLEGEDPVTPGSHSGERARQHVGEAITCSLAGLCGNPGTVKIPQYCFNKTKQHTPTSIHLPYASFVQHPPCPL